MDKKEKVSAFLKKAFPHHQVYIDEVGEKSAILRQPIGAMHLRPGDTVAGPVLMTIADQALYVAILGELGLVALAVTTSFTINFLNKPAADRDIIADCRLIKVGKRLVVGEVFMYSEGIEEPVAHAVGTYSIPGRKA